MAERPELSPAAMALLARRAARATAPATVALECAPLSFEQLGQWFFAHLHPDATVFNMPKVLELEGVVDLDALRAALRAVVDRHAVLRTTFALEGAEPIQRVRPAREVAFAFRDLRDTPPGDQAATVDHLLAEDAGQPFDLTADQLIRAILLRLSEQSWRLQLTFHHIAFDGWSTQVFLEELALAYRAAATGTAVARPPLPCQVADAAAWQRAQSSSPAFERDGAFWRQQLRDLPALELPTDFPSDAVPRHRGDARDRLLSPAQWTAIGALARHAGCTPFTVTAAAWAVLVARRCGQPECLLGIPTAGRERTDWEPLIGNFARVIPLPLTLQDQPSFGALLSQVQRVSAESLDHGGYPVQQLAAELTSASGAAIQNLFPVIFNFRNYPLSLPAELPKLRITGLTAPARGSVAPLNLEVSPEGDGARLHLEFDADLFDGATAERWLDGYLRLLDAALADPGQQVGDLPLMADREKALLNAWNSTTAPHDATATLHGLIARQVRATPDRIAVRSAEGEWTFRDLDGEARRVAGLLCERAIGPGAVVAVCMERSLAAVASLLGVLQAGAAYVPIDATTPLARLRGMLEDAGVTLMLTGPASPNLPADPRWEMLSWDATPRESLSADCDHGTSQDPAYVLFTSGSTGRPKAAVILHSGIVNHVEWMQARFPLDAHDRILQKTALSSDAAVWEFWAPLHAGATLVLAPPGTQRDPHALADTLRREAITVVQFVPTMMRAVLDRGGFAGLPALRLLCCGGEALTWDLVRAFRQQHQAPLVNLYGPTEASIDATFWIADRDEAPGPVPLGRPIANMRVEICDPAGRQLPVGAIGEMVVAGVGVGTGYLGRPELTAERFAPDPAFPGQRRYRTGDRARWRHDGLVEFLGRLDQQIKLRGYRIEPGEIEAMLRGLPEVRDAAVTVETTDEGERLLVAHVEAMPGTTPDPAALRAALRGELPDYMIPAAIAVLSSLPMLPSGKVDRKALEATRVHVTAPAMRHPDAADSTLEFTLKESWRRLLRVPDVGLDDDFFALGGHSLLAAQMADELARDTGYRLPLAALFEASTIRTLLPRLLRDGYPADRPGVQVVQLGAAGTIPFFMLTGDLMGGGFYCRELIPAVDPSQPIHAIAPAAPTRDAELGTIEGMARLHLEDIRRVQPAGPYRLGGYCVGGLVAYEMARQLEAAGASVDVLILADPSDPFGLDWLVHPLAVLASRVGSHDAEARLSRLAYLKGRARSVAAESLTAQLGAMASYPVRLVARLFGVGMRERRGVGPEEDGLPEASTAYARMNRHHSRAQSAYRHAPYRGRVDLLLSAGRLSGPVDPVAAWRRIAPAVEVHRSTAGHTEIVFQELPQLLAAALARANDHPQSATRSPS